MAANPSATMSLHNIVPLVAKVLHGSCTPINIANGFRAAEIYPYNPNIFSGECISQFLSVRS